MLRRTLLHAVATFAVSVIGLALAPAPAMAQPMSDVDAVKAANAAFYAALSARDVKKMEAVWATKAYVVNMGPRLKTFAVGHDEAVAKWWPAAFEHFLELNVSMSTVAQLQVNGNAAWVVGNESATGVTKAGPVKFQTFVTNIFEKDGGRWLMVSHHAQPIPQ